MKSYYKILKQELIKKYCDNVKTLTESNESIYYIINDILTKA